MELTNKYAKLLAARIAGKEEKQIIEPVEEEERIPQCSDVTNTDIPAETQCETKKFIIPPTLDELECVPKNVHYITNAPSNTSFVVIIDENPHIENPVHFRKQILDGLHVYIEDGDEDSSNNNYIPEDYSINNLRDTWPYKYKFEDDGSWKLEALKSFKGESLVDGFFKRLKPLTYTNGNLIYEHKGEQYRLQLSGKMAGNFTFYCYNYSKAVGLKNSETSYKYCDISYWIKCSGGCDLSNASKSNITYRDLFDNLKKVIEDLMEQDSEEILSEDKIKFLQGEYRGTPIHEYVDHDGNPCGAMEYYCSKTWTNEHYTLMTQKGDRAWDVYRWIIGYITSMDFMSQSVEYRHFIWFACSLSSIGKSKMLEKCFTPSLVCDPNPTNGEDTFSKRRSLMCPLLVADDGDLKGLSKNKSYLTRLNKRVGNGIIPTRLMREEEVDIARTVFNMTVSNVEPPKELIANDTTNILTSKCRYVYVNLSSAIYNDDSTDVVNIQRVCDKIGSEIPDRFRNRNLYDADVDLFKSDCLRFYKANPGFMDKYLGAMKQANTSGAKTCFEDYIDYAESNNAWGCDYENDKLMPLGMLFLKQIRCEDDYATLKKYFEQWSKEKNLSCESAKRRIKGITKNPVSQYMVSKDMIMRIYTCE